MSGYAVAYLVLWILLAVSCLCGFPGTAQAGLGPWGRFGGDVLVVILLGIIGWAYFHGAK